VHRRPARSLQVLPDPSCGDLVGRDGAHAPVLADGDPSRLAGSVTAEDLLPADPALGEVDLFRRADASLSWGWSWAREWCGRAEL